MSEIKAFVGHSFTPDDQEIVEKFLRFFSTVSKSMTQFSWEHAESAEPHRLDEKVMRLMEDKNTFIGICTKKERAASDGAFKRGLFRTNVLHVEARDVSWKTSDWIIQEIGYAKAKDLHLILLIEEGVRAPGGLQGNVEYIQFKRDNPEQKFDSIIQMIGAISQKIRIAPLQPSETLPPNSDSSTDLRKGEDNTPKSSDNWREPKPAWTPRQYRIAFMHFTAIDDDAAAENIDRKYLETIDSLVGDEKTSWEAFKEYARVGLTKGGSLEKLKSFARTHPESSGAHRYLAKGYEEFDEHLKAAEEFFIGSGKTSETRLRLGLLGDAAISFTKAGANERKNIVIEAMKEIVTRQQDLEKQLLHTLRDIAEIEKEGGLYIAAAERLIEVSPDDADARFQLAYKHAECGNKDLALLHYHRIPYDDRTPSAWNNLGVALDELSIPAKAIANYKQAAEKGETLAVSNIAQKLTGLGFLDEAADYLKKVINEKDCHKNVVHSLASLKDIPEEEDAKLRETVDAAKPKSDFYRLFGRGICKISCTNLRNLWKGPDCDLIVELSGLNFLATGTYEKDTASLSYISAALLENTSAGSVPMTTHKIEYKGRIRGAAIEGTISRARFRGGKKITTALTEALDTAPALMVISDDGLEIKVMESNSSATQPLFYSLQAYK